MSTIETVLRAFPSAKRRDDRHYSAKCPAHGDTHASLGILVYADGGVGLKCFAGCERKAVLKAAGLTQADLMNGSARKQRNVVPVKGRAYPTLDSACAAARQSVAKEMKIDAGDVVEDERFEYARNGKAVAWNVRFNLPTAPGVKQEKTFRPVRAVDGGFTIGAPEMWPLYNADSIGNAELVTIHEGERKADAAAQCGLVAVGTGGGANGVEKTDFAALAHAKIIAIFPDNDAASEKWRQTVEGKARAVNPSCVIKVVRLPELPPKGDFYDFATELRSGQSAEDIASEVLNLIEKAEPIKQNSPPPATSHETSPRIEPILRCLADIAPREISWLWPGRIPAGRITLLVGRPGEGKSFFTTYLAALVSRGGCFPDNTSCPQGDVLFISAEDDPGDTIRPRLDAHGADVSKIHLLSGSRLTAPDGKKSELFFTLSDLAVLETAILSIHNLQLIVIDPIGSFLGGRTDTDKDNAVRAILAPIARLAERYGVAVLIVAHRRKSSADFADDTALGSRAFVGIARCVWHLTRDADNRERRLFLSGKNNLVREGEGLGFVIEGNPARLWWESDAVRLSADEGMRKEREAERERPGPAPLAREAAETWLAQLLANGPMHVGNPDSPEHGTIRAEAKSAGMSWPTVRRAADKLGVESQKCPFTKRYQWLLKQPEQPGPVQNNLSNLSNHKNPNKNDDLLSSSREVVRLRKHATPSPDPSMRTPNSGVARET